MTAAKQAFQCDAGCSPLQRLGYGEALPVARCNVRLDAQPLLPLNVQRSAAR